MKNKTKEKLKRGEIVIGHFILEFATPGIGYMAANAGCDYLIFDMEHTSFSEETIRQAILSAKAAGVTPIVRCPDTEYFLISRPLDAGAEGIMVPRVETRDQAIKIVESVKYPPIGIRGSAFAIAHDDYKGGDASEKIRNANEETLVIVQTETAKAVDNIDEILSVKGIDVAWLGQSDMTVSLGIPGQYDNPLFLRVFDRVLNACNKYGVALGYIPLNMDEAKSLIDKGVKCLAYSADIFLYSSVLNQSIKELHSYIGSKGQIFSEHNQEESPRGLERILSDNKNIKVIDLGGGRKYKLTW